ncbi:hypothetical protein OTK49_21080 [Vibrio coralliirubri]|uniref:hypothetical protein n=1 Tax=Vibrio coralliirubri TaxID=1516159 RepID=UPI00228487E6|nr:hypothetical protein [Vibrio coralliirubri]MCY9865014.1 hypothetical protein [Vibrio coralliirubri]
MTTIFLTNKNAKANTAFNPCTIYIDGDFKFGLLDEDGDLVGLSHRDAPYCLDTMSEIHTAANRGIRANAPYNGFSVTKGFNGAFFLVEASDICPESHQRDQDLIKRSQDLIRQTTDLLARITGENQDHLRGTTIEGEYYAVSENHVALIK